MPTNQKYSARIHSRRQLVIINNNLEHALNKLLSVGNRYQEALPKVSVACEEMVKMIVMIQAMVNDVRENI